MSEFDAVIFDCDGVLVDSEGIAQEVLAAMLARHGVVLTLAQVHERFFGKTVQQCIGIAERLAGKPIPDAFIAAWREDLYREFRERPVRAVPGVADVLADIDVPMCVASNGPLEKMRATLGVTGLLPAFQGRLFSPDSGLPGKPQPDLFLAAAASVGVEPARCAVIEDSAGGARGARTAGMQVFGFTGLPHIDAAALEAAGAVIFSDMQALPGLLRE